MRRRLRQPTFEDMAPVLGLGLILVFGIGWSWLVWDTVGPFGRFYGRAGIGILVLWLVWYAVDLVRSLRKGRDDG